MTRVLDLIAQEDERRSQTDAAAAAARPSESTRLANLRQNLNWSTRISLGMAISCRSPHRVARLAVAERTRGMTMS